jgi:hypothetical protein
MTTGLFTADQAARLRRPHVARAWFARINLPSGVSYLHSGYGTVTVEGQDWIGVDDPFGGRAIGIGQIDEPRFGSAAAVTIVLTGVNLEFLRSVRELRRSIEGRPADIFFGLFDQETQELIGPLVPLFDRGRMTAPAWSIEGVGLRTVTITVENIWASQNYAPSGRWNDSDHQRRFPGDRFFQWVGVKIQEVLK